MVATVIVSLQIMPDSTDTDFDKLTSAATEKITAFGGTVGKTELQEVAFGLKSLNIMFALPEEKGSTEPLEAQLSKIAEVKSVQVTDVRRAIG